MKILDKTELSKITSEGRKVVVDEIKRSSLIRKRPEEKNEVKTSWLRSSLASLLKVTDDSLQEQKLLNKILVQALKVMEVVLKRPKIEHKPIKIDYDIIRGKDGYMKKVIATITYQGGD